MNDRGEVNTKIIVFVILIIAICILAARGISISTPKAALAMALGVAACIATFINPKAGLYILTFSMLLSPEFTIAEVPKRAVVVRMEDILLIVIFLTWLVRLAVNKELGILKFTPLNKLLLYYIAFSVLVTGIAIIQGSVTPLKSFFFLLKYIEYFFLYFMVSNSVHSKEEAKKLIKYMFATMVLICIFNYFRIATGKLATTPFEDEPGEPATLGGYLLLMMPIIMGLFAYEQKLSSRLWLIILFIFAIPPFLFAGSRASFLGFIPMYITMLILTTKKKPLFAIVLASIVILFASGVLHMPKEASEKVVGTFQGEETHIGPIKMKIDPSSAARVDSWKLLLGKWSKSPIWGYGITGIGFFLDGQYFLVLGEMGLIGLTVFLLILYNILKNSYRTFRNSDDDYIKGVSLGFLCATIGLMAHALTTNTFIIVRIMEPFWFLAAIIMFLHESSIPGAEKIIPEKA